MKRFIVFFILGLLFVFLQSAFLASFLPQFLIPNLILTLVVFLSFYETSVFGVVLAFLLGLQLDLYSASILGPWAGASVAVYGIFASLSQRIFIESVFSVFATVFAAVLINNFVYLIIVAEFKNTQTLLWAILKGSPLQALISSLCALLVFRLLKRLTQERSVLGFM